jgi:lipopolysaccharide transport system permease protein
LWLYFSECILRTASFLKDNNAIFSKVYFPRLIVPISLVITNLVKLMIHLGLFFIVYIYYAITNPSLVRANSAALLFPLLIVMIALLGMGSGLIVSSLTTRYKDLSHLVTFGVQLLMFMSPVIYPLASFENTTFYNALLLNPMTGIIETFRYGFLGQGYFSVGLLLYDITCILGCMMLGIILYNGIEREFVDTI